MKIQCACRNLFDNDDEFINHYIESSECNNIGKSVCSCCNKLSYTSLKNNTVCISCYGSNNMNCDICSKGYLETSEKRKTIKKYVEYYNKCEELRNDKQFFCEQYQKSYKNTENAYRSKNMLEYVAESKSTRIFERYINKINEEIVKLKEEQDKHYKEYIIPLSNDLYTLNYVKDNYTDFENFNWIYEVRAAWFV